MQYRQLWEQHLDRLDEYLQQLQRQEQFSMEGPLALTKKVNSDRQRKDRHGA
jgi:hypothetical protein